MGYAEAFERQTEHHAEVLSARERNEPELGRILTVEHDPVITVSRRPSAAGHVIASEDALKKAGVTLSQTDRGGDVTYHGPGQLVVYPILDLKRLRLRLHEHMRLMEQAVIDTLSPLGLRPHRDPTATGVWVDRGDGMAAKVCAMGVRVRRWVSMHGLALNVRTNLAHFDLIVPCGLEGRPVTSLQALLDDAAPSLDETRARLTSAILDRLAEHASEKGVVLGEAG